MKSIGIVIPFYNTPMWIQSSMWGLLNSIETYKDKYDIQLLLIDNAADEGDRGNKKEFIDAIKLVPELNDRTTILKNPEGIRFHGTTLDTAVREFDTDYLLCWESDIAIYDNSWLDWVMAHIEDEKTWMAGYELFDYTGSSDTHIWYLMPNPGVYKMDLLKEINSEVETNLDFTHYWGDNYSQSKVMESNANVEVPFVREVGFRYGVFSEKRGFKEEQYAIVHPGGTLGRRLLIKVSTLMHSGETNPVIDQEKTLKEGIMEMTSKGLGATSIVDKKGKLAGILTDGDLRRILYSGDVDLNKPLKDVMIKNSKTTTEDTLAVKAIDIMEQYNITVLPVVDEASRPVAMIHLHDLIKAGIIYDNRDNECNCNTGIWTEAIIIYAPNILGNQSGFGKLLFTHRQYFPIKYNRLTFAYRISYQTKIWGNIPYYILPFFFDSNRTEDGLGGAKNLRGILRNRIVGNGFLLANSEIRWKFWRLKFLKQNFYLSLNTFVDAGTITNFYPVNLTDISAGYGFSLTDNLKQINHSTESIHMSYGMGLYIAMNDNFVISTDFGKA